MKVKQLACQLAAAALIFGLPAGAAGVVAEPAAFEGREYRGKAEFCRAYADRAVRAEEINQDLDCGLTGPRWHSERNSHYHWCLNAPRETVKQESRGRSELLERCRKRDEGREEGRENGFCEAYARRAVNAQRINERLDCGFTGPRWTYSRGSHYEWCENVSRSRAERESEARQNQLQRCRRY